jgi:hypothetical protein
LALCTVRSYGIDIALAMRVLWKSWIFEGFDFVTLDTH